MARADEQHLFVRQRPQRTADLEVMARAQPRLHRDLHYWNARVRVHVEKRRPSAVVKAAAAVDRRSEAVRLQQRLRALRHLGRAGGGVAQAIERLRKAGEIVDRLRFGAAREHRQIGFPMRRRDHHRARPGQTAAERAPRLAGRARIERVHR